MSADLNTIVKNVFLILIVVVLVSIVAIAMFYLDSSFTNKIMDNVVDKVEPLQSASSTLSSTSSSNTIDIETFESMPPEIYETQSRSQVEAIQHPYSITLSWSVRGADQVYVSPLLASPRPDIATVSADDSPKPIVGSANTLLYQTSAFFLTAVNTVTGQKVTKKLMVPIVTALQGPSAASLTLTQSYSPEPTDIRMHWAAAHGTRNVEIVVSDGRRYPVETNGKTNGSLSVEFTKPGIYQVSMIATSSFGSESKSIVVPALPPSVQIGQTLSSPHRPLPMITYTWNRVNEVGKRGLPYAAGTEPELYQPSILTIRGNNFEANSIVYINFETGYVASTKVHDPNMTFEVVSRPIGYVSTQNISIVGTNYSNYAPIVVRTIAFDIVGNVDNRFSITGQGKSLLMSADEKTDSGRPILPEEFDSVNVSIQSYGSPLTFTFHIRLVPTDNDVQEWTTIFSNVKPACINRVTCPNQPMFPLSKILNRPIMSNTVVQISITLDNSIHTPNMSSKGSSIYVENALEIFS